MIWYNRFIWEFMGIKIESSNTNWNCQGNHPKEGDTEAEV